MNRKWGDMSNKLGTVVEDLVAPRLPRIIAETLGMPVIGQMLRRKRRLPDGRVKELDAIALTTDRWPASSPVWTSTEARWPTPRPKALSSRRSAISSWR